MGNVEVFVLMAIVNKIPSNGSRIKRIFMKNIEISKGDEGESVEWIDRYCDDEWTQSFVVRLLECECIFVSGWRNKENFWNKHLDDIHRTFDVNKRTKISLDLQHCLEHCPIKELIYSPQHPKQDRIPHILIKFMLRFKCQQIETLKLDFASSSKLYQATINKTMRQQMRMIALRHLEFGWNDRDSYKVLKYLTKERKALEYVKLTLPELRDLSKHEEKTIANIKLLCDNVCIQKKENGILMTGSQEY